MQHLKDITQDLRSSKTVNESHLAALDQVIADLVACQEEQNSKLRQMEYILDRGGLGSWDWWMETDRVVYSPQSCRMLGLKLDDLNAQLNSWDSRIHPQDLPGVYEAVRSHLRGDLAIYEMTYRIQHKDGSWRWIMDRGTVTERNSQGQPTRFTGTHFDVTLFKEIEIRNTSELQKARDRFNNLLEFVPVGIFETDINGNCTFVNSTWSEMTKLKFLRNGKIRSHKSGPLS
jgi:PAS domain S-box-containing protein